jgi:hypothetical protein
MTISAHAATHPAGRGTNGLDYRPGECNIGPAEIARRRWAGHLGLLLALGWLATLVVLDAPPLARLSLALPVAASASGYLQAWLRFCAGFGSRGVYNFGPLDQLERVIDPAARSEDRRKAAQIILASLAIGLVAGVTAGLLAL